MNETTASITSAITNAINDASAQIASEGEVTYRSNAIDRAISLIGEETLTDLVIRRNELVARRRASTDRDEKRAIGRELKDMIHNAAELPTES